MPSTTNNSAAQALTMQVQLSGDDEERAEMEVVASFLAKMVPQSDENIKYAASRKKEIDGLLERGVFSPASLSDARGYRTFGSRFVDYEKNAGTPDVFEKSRFVSKNYNDDSGFMTYAPTVMRASQRLLLSMGSSDKKTKAKFRDVDQAFTQAKTRIQRPIFIRPPPILGYPPDFFLRVELPLYGSRGPIGRHLQRVSQGQAQHDSLGVRNLLHVHGEVPLARFAIFKCPEGNCLPSNT